MIASKRCVTGHTVFAYTFASPATTTSTTADTSSYDCIFIVINTDDLVPKLPLSDWDFVRYGEDVPGSIEDSYASQWDALTGLEYSHGSTKQSTALTKLSAVASGRDSCYTYPGGTTASRINCNETFLSETLAKNASSAFTAQYPLVTNGTYRCVSYGQLTYYSYYVEYKPAMLMMLIAEVMTSLNLIDKLPFALCDLPLYLDTPRDALVSYALHASGNAVSYPHYVEGYYLLAQNLTP